MNEPARAPWPDWTGPAALGILAAVAAGPPMLLGQRDAAAVIGWQLGGDAAALAFLWYLLRRRLRLGWKALGTGRAERHWLLAAPLPLALGCVTANLIYNAVLLAVFGHVPAPMVTQFFAGLQSHGQVALAALLTLVVAPISEEAVFRLVILQTLRGRMPNAAAIWLSALLFGAYHLDPVALVPATLLGAALGWAFVRSRSILVPIAAHAIFNSFGLLALLVTGASAGGGA